MALLLADMTHSLHLRLIVTSLGRVFLTRPFRKSPASSLHSAFEHCSHLGVYDLSTEPKDREGNTQQQELSACRECATVKPARESATSPGLPSMPCGLPAPAPGPPPNYGSEIPSWGTAACPSVLPLPVSSPLTHDPPTLSRQSPASPSRYLPLHPLLSPP